MTAATKKLNQSQLQIEVFFLFFIFFTESEKKQNDVEICGRFWTSGLISFVLAIWHTGTIPGGHSK